MKPPTLPTEDILNFGDIFPREEPVVKIDTVEMNEIVLPSSRHFRVTPQAVALWHQAYIYLFYCRGVLLLTRHGRQGNLEHSRVAAQARRVGAIRRGTSARVLPQSVEIERQASYCVFEGHLIVCADN